MTRGRPRKSGKRRPSGDLCPTTDYGTPQLMMHRAAAILGSASIDDVMVFSAARDQRASYALGILFARGELDEYQHAVGCRYQRLCSMARYQPPERPSVLAGLVAPSVATGDAPTEQDETPDERWQRNRATYLDVQRVLRGCDAWVRKILDNVAVFGMMPRPDEMGDLKAGLLVLQRYYRSEAGASHE